MSWESVRKHEEAENKFLKWFMPVTFGTIIISIYLMFLFEKLGMNILSFLFEIIMLTGVMAGLGFCVSPTPQQIEFGRYYERMDEEEDGNWFGVEVVEE